MIFKYIRSDYYIHYYRTNVSHELSEFHRNYTLYMVKLFAKVLLIIMIRNLQLFGNSRQYDL